MTWNPNSQKHKANHGGYKQKPSQVQVSALLSMYKETLAVEKPKEKKVGVQLKIVW